MQTTLIVLIVLAATDLVVCGLVLAVVWVVHRRLRRLAVERGEPIPPAATGQFVFLAALGLVGIAVLYAAAALLLEG